MGLKGILAVLVVLLLAPVVFVSGCVEGGTFQSLFGSLTGQQEKVVAPNDVLLIENVQVIPNPPITADSTFSVAFQVVNKGTTQEGSMEARGVDVFCYDWGRCHPSDPMEGVVVYAPTFNASPKTIYPGGAELVEFTFRAPTNTELGRMEGNCPIRYKVFYNFDAMTTSDIAIVSRNRLVDAHRAGETLSVTPVQTQSRGPIKISVDFETNQPVDEMLVVPVIIKIYDRGSGMYDKVNQSKLEIIFPPDFDIISCNPTTWMAVSGNTVINSKGDIPLIKGESSPIRCDLKLRQGFVDDIKTYNVVARIMGYKYPLYGEKIVDIKPTYMDWYEGSDSGGDVSITPCHDLGSNCWCRVEDECVNVLYSTCQLGEHGCGPAAPCCCCAGP